MLDAGYSYAWSVCWSTKLIKMAFEGGSLRKWPVCPQVRAFYWHYYLSLSAAAARMFMETEQNDADVMRVLCMTAFSHTPGDHR